MPEENKKIEEILDKVSNMFQNLNGDLASDPKQVSYRYNETKNTINKYINADVNIPVKNAKNAQEKQQALTAGLSELKDYIKISTVFLDQKKQKNEVEYSHQYERTLLEKTKNIILISQDIIQNIEKGNLPIAEGLVKTLDLEYKSLLKPRIESKQIRNMLGDLDKSFVPELTDTKENAPDKKKKSTTRRVVTKIKKIPDTVIRKVKGLINLKKKESIKKKSKSKRESQISM